MPHTRRELLGNATCERKIRAVIIARILHKTLYGDCVELMKSLMTGEGVSKNDFEAEIIPYIDLYYKAKELIDKGYCDDLKKE